MYILPDVERLAADKNRVVGVPDCKSKREAPASITTLIYRIYKLLQICTGNSLDD